MMWSVYRGGDSTESVWHDLFCEIKLFFGTLLCFLWIVSSYHQINNFFFYFNFLVQLRLMTLGSVRLSASSISSRRYGDCRFIENQTRFLLSGDTFCLLFKLFISFGLLVRGILCDCYIDLISCYFVFVLFETAVSGKNFEVESLCPVIVSANSYPFFFNQSWHFRLFIQPFKHFFCLPDNFS